MIAPAGSLLREELDMSMKSKKIGYSLCSAMEIIKTNGKSKH
jgi:hypothetical protein